MLAMYICFFFLAIVVVVADAAVGRKGGVCCWRC